MADVTARQGLPLFADYIRFVRRHAALFGALMVVGIVAGIAWSTQQPTSYSATTSVTLTQVPKYLTFTTAELASPEVSIDTDAQLLRSPEVLGAIGAVLGTDIETAEQHMTVTAAPLTHLLRVTITAGDPDRAADAADAAAGEFIELRRTTLASLQQDQLVQLRLLLSQKERELAREQASRMVVPATDELVTEILELRSALDELEGARREPATLVNSAVPPNKADYANAEVPVVTGAMLGLLGGCLLGAGRDRLRLLATDSSFAPHLSHLAGGRLPAPTTPREDSHAV